MANEMILLKQYLTDKDYQDIHELEKQCYAYDKTKLKLELEYKLSVMKREPGLNEINEFFYYVGDQLVAYLAISSFGGSNIAEINGMTHPDYRRKGVFQRLFSLASDELAKRNFTKILLLADGKSNSGPTFIKSVGGVYQFSEYRMKYLNDEVTFHSEVSIMLRRASELDGLEVVKLDTLFFQTPEDLIWSLEEEKAQNKCTYMIELDGKVIGKIAVSYTGRSAYISGFGILPEYRGQGCGRAALAEVLKQIHNQGISEIELDVESKNEKALNLYKACGFEVLSVMSYYQYAL